MTDQEALDLVRAVLTGGTDPNTVTNVRPALQRLAAVVAGAGVPTHPVTHDHPGAAAADRAREVARLWMAVKLHRDQGALGLGPLDAAADALDAALDRLAEAYDFNAHSGEVASDG